MTEIAQRVAQDPELLQACIDHHKALSDHREFSKALQVRHKDGGLRPYVLQPSQLKLLKEVERQQALGLPVRIVALKARQVMMSTAVAGLFYQRLGFQPGIHARVVAHEQDAARDIFEYYKTFNDHYRPLPAMAKCELDNDRQEWIRWSNDSWCRVLTAGNHSSGRSATVSLWHLSEFAFWPSATTLLRGIMGSVPKIPESMVIVESTANGMGNEFHKLCREAMDPARKSRWGFVFFGWHEHPEYHLALDCPEADFFADLRPEEIDLMKRFRLTLEQLAWRRVMIKDEFNGDEEGFKQEFPSTPTEAFITTGRPYFSIRHLTTQPVIEPALIGELQQEHVGVREETFVVPNERGALRIWKQPQPGHAYTLGADPAKGEDIMEGEGVAQPDWSVAAILDYRSGEQVASFRARVVTSEFGRILDALARWYNFAYVVCEGDGLGRACLEEVLRRDYPPGLIYSDRPDLLQGDVTSFKLGYQPTQTKRLQLLARLQLAVLERSVIIRDEVTLSECMTFVYRPDGKPEHQATCHDDAVFALAYALTGIHFYPARYLKDPDVARGKRQAQAKWGLALPSRIR